MRSMVDGGKETNRLQDKRLCTNAGNIFKDTCRYILQLPWVQCEYRDVNTRHFHSYLWSTLQLKDIYEFRVWESMSFYFTLSGMNRQYVYFSRMEVIAASQDKNTSKISYNNFIPGRHMKVLQIEDYKARKLKTRGSVTFTFSFEPFTDDISCHFMT